MLRAGVYPQGVELIEGGARYRVWAPERKLVEAEILPAGGGPPRRLRLEAQTAGYHSGIDPEGQAGDRYQYLLDGEGPFPDPASRAQPDGVHGPSMLVDPKVFPWHDANWVCPPLRDLVLYEIHVGTFTPEGTFLAAIDRLPYLRQLGVNAIQIMPVADFPGNRNWGYDGVCLYAPARCYGTPDDLRALVDAAHAQGIAAVLDVVYNHFGPDGNYLGLYSRFYFNPQRHTPWGASLNIDGPHCAAVREFFLANARYWIDEFHFDGLRLDATHAIHDSSCQHFLAEISALADCPCLRRRAFFIAEDERNLACLIESHGMDAVYADDFCHSVQVALGDLGYHEDFDGSAREIVQALAHGWLYRGQVSPHHRKPRGTEAGHLPPEHFAYCISNHDQVGNRAFGERLHQLTSPEGYRAASALLLLAPGTPMLFMGQEWGATTPFLFFTQHHPKLGRQVTAGRRKEFARFPQFRDPQIARTIPDPQSEETFRRSKLQWAEITGEPHASLLAMYRECLRLRNTVPAFRPRSRQDMRVADIGITALCLNDTSCRWLILAHLGKGSWTLKPDQEICGLRPAPNWRPIFSSNETRFGGSRSLASEGSAIHFDGPELLLIHVQS